MPTPIPNTAPAIATRAASANVFLRLPHVLARVSISRSTLWRRVNDGTFPRPLKLSERVTVWRSEDIEAWMKQQQ